MPAAGGGAASRSGGTRTRAPAASRASGFTRPPSTRIWPERVSLWIWTWFSAGQRRLSQRSSRSPSSAAATSSVWTCHSSMRWAARSNRAERTGGLVRVVDVRIARRGPATHQDLQRHRHPRPAAEIDARADADADAAAPPEVRAAGADREVGSAAAVGLHRALGYAEPVVAMRQRELGRPSEGKPRDVIRIGA